MTIINSIHYIQVLSLVHNNDIGAACVTSVVSVTGKDIFFTSQIISLMLNFSKV